MRSQIEIFTDGACLGNPGPGGFAAIIKSKDEEKEISGGAKNTTNNRMEMMAVIKGLEFVKTPSDILVFSDSTYVVNAINRNWLKNWHNSNWKSSTGKDVKNIDLWQAITELLELHCVEFRWIRGHRGHVENERCDTLAVAAANKFRILESN